MSFSSPLYWQLKYIVQDCFSAASTKSTAHEVEEIEQLTTLYGDDADTFLLQSLLNTVRKTDLNHIKGQKAALIFFARKIIHWRRLVQISAIFFANLYFLTRTMTFHQLLTKLFWTVFVVPSDS